MQTSLVRQARSRSAAARVFGCHLLELATICCQDQKQAGDGCLRPLNFGVPKAGVAPPALGSLIVPAGRSQACSGTAARPSAPAWAPLAWRAPSLRANGHSGPHHKVASGLAGGLLCTPRALCSTAPALARRRAGPW